MTCWEQALWMGDVVADREYDLLVSDGVGSANITIEKGSWWANALVFWEWVESESGESLSLGVSFDSATQEVTFANTDRVYAFDAGGSLVDEVAGGVTSGAHTWTTGGVFLPSYPVRAYDVGNIVHGATSVRAMSGQASTVVGIVQPMRSIQTQFAPGELVAWRSLWASHLSRGRSASFWHTRDALPSSTALDLSTLGACDQLVSEPSITRWNGRRTVQYRNVALHDEDAIDYRRRPNVPLSEPGIQSYYIPPTTAW